MKQLRKVEKFKDQGNELLKQTKLTEAIEQYTLGLEQDASNTKLNAILLSNRALCYLKQEKLELALEDCNASIHLNPKYVKSYHRRAEIKVKQGEYDDAVGDYHTMKEIDPS